MLDIRLLREKPDWVKERLATRGGSEGARVDEILALDTERRRRMTEVERLKSEHNTLNKEIGVRKARGESADDLMTGMRERSETIARLDSEVSVLDQKQHELVLRLPNLPHEKCPIGQDASQNPVVHTWGKKSSFSFKPLDHISLCEKLGILDFATAAKISGSGFILFKGVGAKLERALIQFLLDLHTEKHGYTEVSPPFLVREESMIGTGQLPKFSEEMYRLANDPFYLVPTAEVPITNMHREEILPHTSLPLCYAAYTPCFRREAGSAGAMNRGMLRVHQFDKVELVKITEPSKSYEEHETLRRDAEKVLELLGLHYRTIELCTGDLGNGAAKCYDIEVWAPGTEAYLEVSSCSNFEDYQARRMHLRYKDASGKNHFCHTLNASGTALPRLYVALVETYQQADGSILLPEILQPYVGKKKIEAVV